MMCYTICYIICHGSNDAKHIFTNLNTMLAGVCLALALSIYTVQHAQKHFILQVYYRLIWC